MEATELFQDAIQWLQDHYTEHRFFAERDIVWVVQLRIAQEIERASLLYRVFNDHTIIGQQRADLVILQGDSIEVAAEFKYEPSHNRTTDQGGDIRQSKLDSSVVSWRGEGSVGEDIQRAREYVTRRRAKAACSIFIDEGGHFRRCAPHPGSEWVDWGRNTSELRSQQPASRRALQAFWGMEWKTLPL